MGYANCGRRPQPAKLKILRGNPSKTKFGPDLEAPPGEVVKPGTLSPGAAVVWDRTAWICLQMGTLTVADLEAFVRMCELQASFDANVAVKDTEAFSWRQEIELARSLRAYSALFGLEPISRVRLHPRKAEDAPVSKWAGAIK